MAKGPRGDLGGMTMATAIPKEEAATAVPFGSTVAPVDPSPVTIPAATADKSLTVKLRGDLYEALRSYCYETGRATHARVTHQDVMVEALKAFLASKS